MVRSAHLARVSNHGPQGICSQRLAVVAGAIALWRSDVAIFDIIVFDWCRRPGRCCGLTDFLRGWGGLWRGSTHGASPKIAKHPEASAWPAHRPQSDRLLIGNLIHYPKS